MPGYAVLKAGMCSQIKQIQGPPQSNFWILVLVAHLYATKTLFAGIGEGVSKHQVIKKQTNQENVTIAEKAQHFMKNYHILHCIIIGIVQFFGHTYNLLFPFFGI